MVGSAFSPDDVSGLFPAIRPYIQDLHAHFDGESPDVVLDKLLRGKYFLHSFADDGFFVVQYYGIDFFIVSAYAFKLRARVSLRIIIQTACEYAKGHGFETISFVSPRPAWVRLAPRMGFRYCDGVYLKDLI